MEPFVADLRDEDDGSQVKKLEDEIDADDEDAKAESQGTGHGGNANDGHPDEDYADDAIMEAIEAVEDEVTDEDDDVYNTRNGDDTDDVDENNDPDYALATITLEACKPSSCSSSQPSLFHGKP